MTRKRRHTNTRGFRAIRRGKTAKEVKEMERKFVKEVKMKDRRILKAPDQIGGSMIDMPEAVKGIVKRRAAAKSPATIRLLKDGEVTGSTATRRRGRMWMITEKIRQLFIPGGITTDGGHLSDETCKVAMTFAQGTYVDLTGHRREHRWRIIVENIDHIPEGVCPECDGEMETEILDDNKRRVVCNDDDCGYELSSFCGVEVIE